MAQVVDSFKKNYPELVEGRRIIVIDCTAFGHDPETEGKGSREHKGSHYETMTSLLNAENWQEVNAPLEEIDFDGDNLVICACKVGRHRAVANKESILPAMAAILYANDKSRVGSIDLQSLTHWKTICGSICTQCRINPLAEVLAENNSEEHLVCLQKAYKLVEAIIPEPSEADQQSADDSPTTAEYQLRDMMAEYGSRCTRKVLKALRFVFDPKQTRKISKVVAKIEDELVELVLAHAMIDQATVESLFVAHDDRPKERWHGKGSGSSREVKEEPVEEEPVEEEMCSNSDDDQARVRLPNAPPSDQDCEFGTVENRRSVTGLTADEDWGGPTRGHDRDTTFLTNGPMREKDLLLPYKKVKDKEKNRGRESIAKEHPDTDSMNDPALAPSGSEEVDTSQHQKLRNRRVIQIKR